ncbi:cobyrinate a,c-diamide synthase [Actinoplanes teichomyceticus]|uniref:cobyrinate a,c-diamide synthase n=1 Tax=Actinoplanes teichomyceticus TaxID=1867 RepID=UPI001EF294E3|nr:cobyrinate a,c-diamide synthase [Actinoplanes teichomyceticus]
MSAPSSGHGKTAIAVGLLAAMAARGLPTAGFKVGPDHTDAAYLGLAAGRPGRNLDPRLVGAQRIAPLFGHGASGAQLSVIEGAMGLFDSLTWQPEVDGTAAVAATLRAPVALVVDVAAMGHSLAALVHGFRMFDEMVHLGGVILNRVASPRHEQMLRSALDDIGMPVLGALRRGDLPNVLPSRAHGLVPVAHRTVEAGRAVRRLGEAVAQALDLDRLMALATSAPPLPGPLWTPAEAAGEPAELRPVVALAGGPGAPYTYVETAELLTAAGADVVVVDPLRDESLPPGTRALIVGSGLPEGYAEELSANHRLCSDVARFARDGWPVVAEGVALPWLGRELDGRPMCGVLDITGVTGEQTVAGYREATAPGTSVLAPAGARITGYKQHRAVVTPRAGAAPAWTWSGGNPEGFVWRQVHASQLGLHWAAAPEIAKRLVAAAITGPGKPGGHGPQPGGHGPQVDGHGVPVGGRGPQAGGHGSQSGGPTPQMPGAPAQPVPMRPPVSVSAQGMPGSEPAPAGYFDPEFTGHPAPEFAPAGYSGPGPVAAGAPGGGPAAAPSFGAVPGDGRGPGPVPPGMPGFDRVPMDAQGSGAVPGFGGVPMDAQGSGGVPGFGGVPVDAHGSGPLPGGAPGFDRVPMDAPGSGGVPGFGGVPADGHGPGPLPPGMSGGGARVTANGPTSGPMSGSVSGPIPGAVSGPLPDELPPADPAPTTGPVPGMFPPGVPAPGMGAPHSTAHGPMALPAGPGPGPASGNGPVHPRPGSNMPNVGPVHGSANPGPVHGPHGPGPAGRAHGAGPPQGPRGAGPGQAPHGMGPGQGPPGLGQGSPGVGAGHGTPGVGPAGHAVSGAGSAGHGMPGAGPAGSGTPGAGPGRDADDRPTSDIPVSS